jgi:endoglucanase
MRSLTSLILVLVATELSGAAALRPFPRVPAPGFATRTAIAAPDGADIQTRFEGWKKNFVFERGDEACVSQNIPYKTNDISCSSSELAYGMLIAVYMDNAANQTRPLFDKFLAAYDKRLDSVGLCGWRWIWDYVDSNLYRDSLWGRHSATDADLDAAMALLLASRQWGDDKYRQRALRLIDAIWDHELDSTFNLKPGDDWDLAKNPGYLNFAAFRLFAQADSPRWDTVAAQSWRLLQRNLAPSNTSVGLPSDWCRPDGTPSTKYGKDFTGYSKPTFHADAMRVPWRLAIEYAWFGEARAKRIDSTIAAWAVGSSSFKGDVRKLTYNYHLDGTDAAYSPYPSFTAGAFGAAGLVDARFRPWVDSCYAVVAARQDNAGYLASVNLLNMLLMSGQFENLWQTVPASIGSRQNLTLNSDRRGIHVPEAVLPPRLRTADGREIAATAQLDPRGGWRIQLPATRRGLVLVDWIDAASRRQAARLLAP